MYWSWNETIRTSTDTVTWDNVSNGTWEDIQFGFVVYKNDLFTAVGSEGSILISLDKGESWNKTTSQTSSYLYGVTYGNEMWIAVGELGTIYNSKGSTAQLTGISNTFYSITYK